MSTDAMIYKKSDAERVKIEVGDAASPEVFTEIGHVLSLTGPDFARTSIDVTDAQSTGLSKVFRGGLVDNGTVTLDFQFNPKNTTHADTGNGLLALVDALNNSNIRITFPNDSPRTTASFAAFVMTGPTQTGQLDGKITASVTFKISGPVTWS